MNAIIVGPNGRPSMKQMLAIFEFDSEVTLYTYRTLRNGNRRWSCLLSKDSENEIPLSAPPAFSSGDKIVMWGTRVEVTKEFDTIVYNPPNVTINASNKKRAREILQEKKIATPLLVKNTELYKVRYPVIIRRDHHRAGIDFHVSYTDEDSFKIIETLGVGPDNYYISEVYPKTEEYRVHCASGKVLLVKRKPEPDDKSIIPWNFHQVEQAWSIVDRKDYNYEMVSLALSAVEAVDLDYGAVDIMSKPSKDGYPAHVVVEINTAPSYTPYLISKYGAYFNLIFSKDSKLVPWDFKKFRKGISLAWKNSQLNNRNK